MIKVFFNVAITGVLAMAGLSATAQQNEFSFSAGGAASGLSCDMKNGRNSLKEGFQAGFGITRSLTSRWGISSGVELGTHRSRASLRPDNKFSSYEVDSEGNAFEYNVSATGYVEMQNLYTVNIPLQVQYQSRDDQKRRFYSRAGVKLMIPFSSEYTARAREINATGYYPDLNVAFTDLPVHGFGKQANWRNEGTYDVNMSLALAGEMGAKFRLSPHSYLYTGVFLDYGLKDVKKEEGTAALLTYSPNGLNQSPSNSVLSLASTTGKVRLMSYGIKCRFAFGSKKK